MLVWVVLAGLIALYVYIEFTPADLDPELIKNQGSRSATFEAGESAVYRSPANGHGLPLLWIKGFNVSRLWEPDGFNVKTVNEFGKLVETDLHGLIVTYQKLLGIDGTSRQPRVLACLGATAHLLAVFFAVALAGGSIKFIDFGDFAEASKHDFDAVIAPKNLLDPSEHERDLVVSRNGELVRIHAKHTASRSVHIDSAAVQDAKVSINGQDIDLSELGTAIAGQLATLGVHQTWNNQDVVLIFTHPVTPYTLMMMLTALGAKSELVVIEPGPMLAPAKPLEVCRPTIIVSEDMTMRTLVRHTDDYRPWDWVFHFMKRLRLAKGCLPKATIPQFETVRIIYTETGADPYSWLNNSETADLRVLCGSQVIHALTTKAQGLPIAQTSLGDYRSGKTLGDNVLLGPPVAGYELKTRGDQLMVRSHDRDWHNANCSAHIGSDGCVYAKLQRHHVSDKYFYTGEM